MADIQRQFIQFDDAIRLRHFDENAALREKRDAVLDRLRDDLVSLRKEETRSCAEADALQWQVPCLYEETPRSWRSRRLINSHAIACWQGRSAPLRRVTKIASNSM